MSDIFISYANEDLERIRSLVEALEAQGWSVFWDRTIPSGKKWREFIEKGLRDARCIVVVWSKTSIKSTWVHDEADVGRGRGILHPVLIDDVEQPLGFNSIQAAKLVGADFRNFSPEFKRFLQDLEGTLGLPRPRESLSSLAGMQHEEQQLIDDMRREQDTGRRTVELRKTTDHDRAEVERLLGSIQDITFGAYKPTDMVKVSKGPFLYGEQKIRVVMEHDYWIDHYPVTNQKYSEFVLEGGYEKPQYWSPEGWKWRTENNITGPAYWKDAKWNKPDHPVVGVSYYEAEAYARWAGKRLPSEQEWEKAARGEDGWSYPWGEEFDKNRCNSSESEIGHTTRVTQFPNGVSPYGCYDMAGNVWEWCVDWYDKTDDRRVIRGGSWNRRPDSLRMSNRFWNYTDFRNFNIGFRLAKDHREETQRNSDAIKDLL